MEQKKLLKTGILGLVVFFAVLFSGCMRYATHNRNEVLLEGINIDQTLKIAEIELSEGGLGSVLTLWAIRDQVITPHQAERVSKLYFDYIDGLEKKFDIWHLTWAVSNMYRQGDDAVRKNLETAYKDATIRAEKIHRVADKQTGSGHR